MNSASKGTEDGDLVETGSVPSKARLGSSVRSKGIYLEIRERLPAAARKSFTVKAGELTLRMGEGDAGEFSRASETVSAALEGIESRPVIPREIEDILDHDDGKTSVAQGRPAAERRNAHRDLRGRARKITFHIFDPLVVEAILDGNLVDGWREEDAETAAENRRRAAWRMKLARSEKGTAKSLPATKSQDDPGVSLSGWAEFEREGLLR